MVNITNIQQLHSLIDRGIIKGCGYCKAEFDLELQEKLLSRINWLIDEGIIEIPKE